MLGVDFTVDLFKNMCKCIILYAFIRLLAFQKWSSVSCPHTCLDSGSKIYQPYPFWQSQHFSLLSSECTLGGIQLCFRRISGCLPMALHPWWLGSHDFIVRLGMFSGHRKGITSFAFFGLIWSAPRYVEVSSLMTWSHMCIETPNVFRTQKENHLICILWVDLKLSMVCWSRAVITSWRPAKFDPSSPAPFF
jgi:hypothetical protein